MLYNAFSIGKKTPKTAPSHWDFVTLPDKNQATASGNMHGKIGKDRAWFRRYPRGQTDTHTQRQTDRQTYLLTSGYTLTHILYELEQCRTSLTSWLYFSYKFNEPIIRDPGHPNNARVVRQNVCFPSRPIWEYEKAWNIILKIKYFIHKKTERQQRANVM